MDSDSPDTAPGSGFANPTGPARITPAFAFAMVFAVVAAFGMERAFVLAHRTLGWVVACSVVALLLDPLVQWLSKKLPRVLAIMAAVLTITATAVVVVVKLISELTTSARALKLSAPQAAAQLEDRSSVARDLQVAKTIEAFTAQLARDLNQETISRVRTAPTYLVTGVLMLFILTRGRRYVSSGLNQISDPKRRERAGAVLRTGLANGRNRLLLVLLQIVVVTVSGFVLFESLDLRASFILAFLMGVASALPFVGLLIAGIPAGVMAYGLHGLSATLTVVGFIVAAELVDLLWWRRFCDRRSVEVGLLLPLVASLVGYELYRVGGAVYSYTLVVLAIAVVAATDIDNDNDTSTWAGPDPDRVPEGSGVDGSRHDMAEPVEAAERGAV